MDGLLTHVETHLRKLWSFNGREKWQGDVPKLVGGGWYIDLAYFIKL